MFPIPTRPSLDLTTLIAAVIVGALATRAAAQSPAPSWINLSPMRPNDRRTP